MIGRTRPYDRIGFGFAAMIHDLANQPRLPDSGLADHLDDLELAGLRPFPGCCDLRQRIPASVERDSAAGVDRGFGELRYSPAADRFPYTLNGTFAQVIDDKTASQSASCHVADHDLICVR